MTEQQLPDDKVLEQIQKLLNLAAKNSNENEAAAAAAKAQELLARYGLNMATVEKASDMKAGKREQAMVDGGTYQHQRELWKAIAKLNNCIHWAQDYSVWTKSKRVGTGRNRYTTEGHVWKKRHVIVGRMVNTQATIAMAGYLQEAIERVTLERLGVRVNEGRVWSSDVNAQRFSNWAVSFKKGATRRVVEQLEDRRRLLEKNEARRRREEQARAERAGVSTATALTLADVRQAEFEANYDFIYGEGEWAKLQAERAEQARIDREEEERYTAWAKANPEEARAQEEAERKKRRQSYRGGRGRQDNVDSGAFWSGYDKAADISLEQQVDKNKVRGLLK